MLNTESFGSQNEFLKILSRSTAQIVGSSINEELFSGERLEQYATHLASELKVSRKSKRGRSLVPELKKSARLLETAYLSIVTDIRNKEVVSPAAEWFVDNFHLIDNQLREIKQSLPDDYYQGLPQLAEGELKGYPRVFALALAIIAHTDSRLDSTVLQKVLLAFQKVSSLQIGEIWALVITLRVVLVQHLTPLARSIVSARESRQKADILADRLLDFAVKPHASEKELLLMLSKELGEPKNFERALIVRLVQRLRDQEPDVGPAFNWIEKQLESLGTNTQQVIQLDLHRQAATQVTICKEETF